MARINTSVKECCGETETFLLLGIRCKRGGGVGTVSDFMYTCARCSFRNSTFFEMMGKSDNKNQMRTQQIPNKIFRHS